MLELQHEGDAEQLLEEENFLNETFSSEIDNFNQTQRDDIKSQRDNNHFSISQSEAYNPNQDKLEILEIRRTYAHLREELVKNSRELVQVGSNSLSELIDQSNIIFSRGIPLQIIIFLFYCLKLKLLLMRHLIPSSYLTLPIWE